ncbi:MAG: peptide chain release factor N(5)-glutamine methyltransferase [Deltaproteobacteria bacterium]|nr:peptide chain release factor N(5)-glutamine methyltransferase [Deltaproteobacteria bacterium]
MQDATAPAPAAAGAGTRRFLAIWGSFRHNRAVIAASAPAVPKAAWTVLEVLRWTTGRFERQGIASARLDAELLATRAFHRTRVELYMHFDQPLGEPELADYRGLVERRLAGEPVAYILGRKEFWSLDFEVGPAVLVPRPETETLVEQALASLRSLPPASRPRRLADVGTGAGAVALALKHECPAAEIVAVDVSADALAVARGNALRLGLDVAFRRGDLVEPLAGLAPFDLVVSNPPYVPGPDIDELAPEVRREPRLALDGGQDGLDLVRRLAADALAVLVPGGILLMEIGAGQAGQAMEILRRSGYARVGSRRDLAGVERVVFGHRGE